MLGKALWPFMPACLALAGACSTPREVERPEPGAASAAARANATAPAIEHAGAKPTETSERVVAPTGPSPAAPTPSEALATGPPAPARGPKLPPDVEAALAYDPDDPLANLEAADALDKRAAGLDKLDKTEAPPRGCGAAGNAVRVWPRPGPAALVAVGDGFLVAGYDRKDAGEQVFLVHWAGGALPRPIGTLPVAQPYPRERPAPPGLGARDAAHAMLAVADGAGALLVADVDLSGGGAGALVPIAQGVDARFAPAVAYTGARTLVAWTEGSTPMRTRLAVLDRGAVVARHDVTPPSAGAAAPAFVAGATPPSLLFVDAHEGMSPVLRVDLAADGTPRPAETAIVVGAVASPPEIAAAMVARRAWLGYTAMGSAAMSAVGLVQIAPATGAPAPLVPGTAYGRLHVSATAGEGTVIFATDAPTATGKDPPRRIEVHVVDAKGAGPAYRIDAPGGASRAAIARADSGLVAVAYTTPSGVYVTRLRCADLAAR